MTITNFHLRDRIDTGFGKFLVSTINRESSSALAHGMTYAETLVFELDDLGTTTCRILTQGESCTGSSRAHDRFCGMIREATSFGHLERLIEADRY